MFYQTTLLSQLMSSWRHLKYSSALIRQRTVTYIMHRRRQHNSPQSPKHGAHAAFASFRVRWAWMTTTPCFVLIVVKKFKMKSSVAAKLTWVIKRNKGRSDVLFIHGCMQRTAMFKGCELMMPDDLNDFQIHPRLKAFVKMSQNVNKHLWEVNTAARLFLEKGIRKL